MKINHKAKSLHEALGVDVRDLNAKMKALHISLTLHKVKSSNVARLLKDQFTKEEILYLATSKALDLVEERVLSPISGLEGLLDFLETMAKATKPGDASKDKGN
jgi:hypothetical protein